MKWHRYLFEIHFTRYQEKKGCLLDPKNAEQTSGSFAASITPFLCFVFRLFSVGCFEGRRLAKMPDRLSIPTLKLDQAGSFFSDLRYRQI